MNKMALTNQNEVSISTSWEHGLKAFTFKFDMPQNTHMHYIII